MFDGLVKRKKIDLFTRVLYIKIIFHKPKRDIGIGAIQRIYSDIPQIHCLP
jgi:hypothetical protein